MTKKERYQKVIDYFQKHMPVAETELHYGNPYELLVAVILSAQCTDKRVNMITPEFFKSFPDAVKLAQSTQDEVFEITGNNTEPQAGKIVFCLEETDEGAWRANEPSNSPGIFYR